MCALASIFLTVLLSFLLAAAEVASRNVTLLLGLIFLLGFLIEKSREDCDSENSCFFDSLLPVLTQRLLYVSKRALAGSQAGRGGSCARKSGLLSSKHGWRDTERYLLVSASNSNGNLPCVTELTWIKVFGHWVISPFQSKENQEEIMSFF